MKLPAITVHADLHPLGVFSWGPTLFHVQETIRMGGSLLLLLAVPGEPPLASPCRQLSGPPVAGLATWGDPHPGDPAVPHILC